MSEADTAPEVEPNGGVEPSTSGSGGDARSAGAKSKAELKVQKGKQKQKAAKGGLFSRMVLFFRQTVAELRKVIWPTRKELINYTWVVLVFVTVMAVIVGILDLLFAKGVLLVFGS